MQLGARVSCCWSLLLVFAVLVLMVISTFTNSGTIERPWASSPCFHQVRRETPPTCGLTFMLNFGALHTGLSRPAPRDRAPTLSLKCPLASNSRSDRRRRPRPRCRKPVARHAVILASISQSKGKHHCALFIGVVGQGFNSRG